jgi:hypothetical protein
MYAFGKQGSDAYSYCEKWVVSSSTKYFRKMDITLKELEITGKEDFIPR